MQGKARNRLGQLSDPTAVRGVTGNESSMIPIHGAGLRFDQAIANDCDIILTGICQAKDRDE